MAAGGLHIIGSERHESRRIDNQLRGRAARQGDPGSSRFFLSFEDPLLKIFAGERLQAVMRSLKIPEGEAIEAKMVTRSIENAQRKVEARNFDIRKQLLEYDDVASDQRKVIYAQRNELLESLRHLARRSPPSAPTCWPASSASSCRRTAWRSSGTCDGLERRLESDFFMAVPVKAWVEKDESLDPDAIAAKVIAQAAGEYEAKFAPIEKEVLHQYERSVMLQAIDSHWREHLAALDYLRQGIHLRGYAQKQPKQEYKREAFELFGSHARLDQAPGDAAPDVGADPLAGRGRGGRAPRRGGRPGAEERPVPPRRLRRGARPGPGGGRGGRAARRRGGRSPSCAAARRSAATIPAPAGRAGSTRTATASSPEPLPH